MVVERPDGIDGESHSKRAGGWVTDHAFRIVPAWALCSTIDPQNPDKSKAESYRTSARWRNPRPPSCVPAAIPPAAWQSCSEMAVELIRFSSVGDQRFGHT